MRSTGIHLIVLIGLAACGSDHWQPVGGKRDDRPEARRARVEGALRLLRGPGDAEHPPEPAEMATLALRSSTPSGRDAAVQWPGVVHAVITPAGRLEGLWGWRPGGLTGRKAGESFPAAFRRFVRAYPDLFDMPDDGAGISDRLALLGEPTTGTAVINGKVETSLRFVPRIAGRRVAHKEVLVTFVGDHLASVTGDLSLPAARPSAEPVIDPDTAAAIARDTLDTKVSPPGSSRGAYQVVEQELLVDDDGSLVHELRLADTAGLGTPYLVKVGADDGQVAGMWAAEDRGPGNNGAQYNVEFFGSSTDLLQPPVEQIRTGAMSWEHGPFVWPWRATDGTRSPTFVFTTAIQPWGSFYQMSPDYFFLAGRGTDRRKFKTQHLSYWTQRAGLFGDAYGGDFLADKSHRLEGVRAIDNEGGARPEACPNGGACYRAARFCSPISTTSPAPEPPANVPCLVFNITDPPDISTIFHEYGHHIDDKLRGDGNRPSRVGTAACTIGDPNGENNAVNETVANAMTLAAFRHFWSSNMAFARDYEAATCGLGGNRGCFLGMGPDGSIHKPGDNNSLACLPRECANDNGYGLGRAFHQAFWEALFHRNCLSNPCRTLSGIGGRAWATYALFYASFRSPGLTTHRQLSANFLNYFYYYVDTTAWGELWWVFDHHGLIDGPKTGLSKCDAER
jgi:hypothetical protein